VDLELWNGEELVAIGPNVDRRSVGPYVGCVMLAGILLWKECVTEINVEVGGM
jgi:hypothetical protein